MIDLHSHILPNTDDGSKSMEQSIEILKEAENAGFSKICLTPHYFEQRYVKTKEENQRKFDELKERLEEEKIKIELILGNEIYINERAIENIDKNILSCIGNSNYFLMELPMNQEIKYLEDIFDEILDRNYKVIIAHPERYSYVQKNPDYVLKYINKGIYFQSNYASIIGTYGKSAEKTVKELLKRRMVHLLATDVHRENSIYTQMEEIINRIKKITDDQYFEIITEINQNSILNNQELTILEPKKKSIFFFS